MAETTVYPFSSGSQYGDWTDSNCESCRKRADRDHPPPVCPCDIEQALLEAYVGDGRVSLPIAERMGALAWKGHYVWPCGEHDPPWANARPAPPRP